MLIALSAIPHFEKLNTKKKNTLLLALPKKNEAIKKSFHNFGNVAVDVVRNLNPVDVLTYKYIILSQPKEAMEFLESKLSPKKLPPKADQPRAEKSNKLIS